MRLSRQQVNKLRNVGFYTENG